MSCMAQGDVDIGLENAGAYLGDTFGPLMRVIWAVGLLAAGALEPSIRLCPCPGCLTTGIAAGCPAAASFINQIHLHKPCSVTVAGLLRWMSGLVTELQGVM